MIVILSRKATKKDRELVIMKLKSRGYEVDVSPGTERTLIGAIGSNPADKESLMVHLSSLPCVERVVPILKPYKKVCRHEVNERTVVKVAKGIGIGGRKIVVMAGPCAVESEAQIMETARALKKLGVQVLRGGAFKPRTSPYSFQGLGEEGLKLLARAREETGLAVITEVVQAEDVPLVAKYADILQIGTRNMQNFNLLTECGRSGRPVMLKRGMSATIEEWLLAAEYIVKEGNSNVILCERGIRTFETHTRNTLDLSAVAAAKELSHLPIVADPSHGTGRRELVAPMAKAAVAAGADGIMIEAHPKPENAVSDAQQTISIKDLASILEDIGAVARAVGRSI